MGGCVIGDLTSKLFKHSTTKHIQIPSVLLNPFMKPYFCFFLLKDAHRICRLDVEVVEDGLTLLGCFGCNKKLWGHSYTVMI